MCSVYQLSPVGDFVQLDGSQLLKDVALSWLTVGSTGPPAAVTAAAAAQL